MRRFAKRAKTALSKKIAPLLPVLFVAAVVAAVVTVLATVTGLTGSVPSVTVPAVGWSLSATVLVFGCTFALGAVVGGGYVLYRRNQAAIEEWWATRSIWVRATIGGFGSAVVVTLGLAAGVVLDLVDPYLVALGFLTAWPLCTTALVLQIRRLVEREKSTLTSVFVGLGYAQLKGLESRTLAVFVGLLAGILAGVLTHYGVAWYLGSPRLLATVGVAVLVLLVVTQLSFSYYESTTSERTDLRILDVTDPDARDVQELTIKNTGNSTVDLVDAKIRDTEFDLYRPGIDIALGPGQSCTFEIPETFSLVPNDDAMDLPLGYTLEQGGETPVVFARSGAVFALQRTAGGDGRPTGPAGLETTAAGQD